MYYCYESDYVKVPAEKVCTPLLYCIYEIVSDWKDLERYLRETIGKDPSEPVGGDLGWSLIPEIQENGSVLYYAWVDEYMGVEPNEGYFDELAVKLHIRKAFENMLQRHPDRYMAIKEIF